MDITDILGRYTVTHHRWEVVIRSSGAGDGLTMLLRPHIGRCITYKGRNYTLNRVVREEGYVQVVLGKDN